MPPSSVLKSERRISLFLLLGAFVLAGLQAVSCSSAEPEILQVDLRVVATLSRETGRVRERLSVFADVYDQDGPEDVAWLVVEYPDRATGWVLEGDRLTYEQRGDRHWYGSAELTLPGTDRVPRGAVRIVAGDLAGRSSTREVQLPATPNRLEEADFPRLERGDGATGAPGEDTAEADAGIILIPAPRATRHYVFVAGALYLLDPPSDSASGGKRGYLDDDILERLNGEPFHLVAEYDSYLWLDSGPWTLADF